MSLPEPVAGVRWRPGIPDDVEAVTAVQEAADRVDEPGNVSARTDVEGWLAAVDPARAVVVGERDGAVVAAGVLFRPGGGPVRLRGAVVPDARGTGIGRVLLRHQIHRAAELHPDAPALGLRTIGDGGAAGLGRRAGFVPVRSFLTMRRDLARPIPRAALPEDLRLAPFTADLDEPLRLAKNEVFRDHWNGLEDGPDEWRSRVLGPQLDRGLTRIAVDRDGRIAGFVLLWRVGGHAQHADIPLVGTTRAQRGRGVARALLLSTLQAAAEAGFTRATLDVDAASPTGAGRVYESVGFEEVQRATIWQRDLLLPGGSAAPETWRA